MKLRHIVMGLGIVAAGWLALYGDKTPASGIAEPVNRTTKASTSVSTQSSQRMDADKAEKEAPITILALESRETLIGGAHFAVPVEGLFVSQTWTPPPPPPPKPPPPPPPTAPSLPFTYLGKKQENGQWEVYLARSDQTYIVQEKSVIENTYRVDAIKPPVLSLTYLPLSQAQTLTIGESD